MISRQRLEQRSAVIRAVRAFFEEHDYLEIDTPLRLPVLVPEVWIEPEMSGANFLQTSPELCMKRLLAAGHPRLFQICHCFRKGERGKYHLPEFSMLEWYHTEIDYKMLMNECESFIGSVVRDCRANSLFPELQGIIDPDLPFERITVTTAFEKYANCSVLESIAKGCYEEVLVGQVEPNLGIVCPTFLFDYPVPLASLARLRKDAPDIAERFELYIGGIEVANGFSELIDPEEQRQRFERDRDLISAAGRNPGPMPEKFLTELVNMRDAAGIALGLDRLVMILVGAKCLDEVVGIVPEEL